MPDEPDDALIVPCIWCGDTCDANNDDEHEVSPDGVVCMSCVQDEAMSCNDCGELMHRDDSCAIYDGNRYVCQPCYEINYFYCDSCDTAAPNEVYGGDGQCENCYSSYHEDDDYCDCGCQDDGNRNVEGIRRWGDKPDYKFHHKSDDGKGYTTDYTPNRNTYYMGMEIELEDSKMIVGPAMMDDGIQDHMVATTDASLESMDGVEIVTMPHTLGAWMHTFPWEWWTNKIHGRVPNQTVYDSNGIHIHVSRSAFANRRGKVKGSHLYKFMQFIQVNEKGIQELSGRTGNQYCKWSQERDAMSRMEDAKTDTSTRNWERYRPINTQNEDTIELRFFAGLSDPVFMKRSIQFVHSLVEFTRHGNFKSDRSWEKYAKYVRGHALRYPELIAYLNKNERKLMVEAVSSEFRYKDTILVEVKRQRELAREEKQREEEQARVEALRIEEAIDRRPACDCGFCVNDRVNAQSDNYVATAAERG